MQLEGCVSWREQIANGYPWRPLAFVAVVVIFIGVCVYGTLVGNQVERDVIEHGTRTTARAIAIETRHGNRNTAGGYSWDANLTWTDAHGQHEQRELPISDAAAAWIGSGRDVGIRYIGDTAVIESDIEYRVRDESNAPWVLGAGAICALLGLYHWRRRLREWRAPRATQW